MHKLKPKTKNTVANRKGNLPKEAKGWKVVDERVKYAISLIEGIDRKIDVQGETTGVIVERTADIVARIPWKRAASNMVILVKGRRKEQFLKALEIHSENPRLSKFEIAHRVIAVMPAKDGDGYPDWRNLYYYMRDMDKRFGCFGS